MGRMTDIISDQIDFLEIIFSDDHDTNHMPKYVRPKDTYKRDVSTYKFKLQYMAEGGKTKIFPTQNENDPENDSNFYILKVGCLPNEIVLK